MRPRKLVKATAIAVVGSLAGSALYRRRATRVREHVDLYAEDGEMVSLNGDSPEMARLLSLARELIVAPEPV